MFAGIERCWTYLTAMWSALGFTVIEGASRGREAVLHTCCALDALCRAVHADATALHHTTQVCVFL